MAQMPPITSRLTILENALKAKNPEIRKEAVKALKTVAEADAFAARLEDMLNDKDIPRPVAASKRWPE